MTSRNVGSSVKLFMQSKQETGKLSTIFSQALYPASLWLTLHKYMNIYNLKRTWDRIFWKFINAFKTYLNNMSAIPRTWTKDQDLQNEQQTRDVRGGDSIYMCFDIFLCLFYSLSFCTHILKTNIHYNFTFSHLLFWEFTVSSECILHSGTSFWECSDRHTDTQTNSNIVKFP